jgi:hypothetical protein
MLYTSFSGFFISAAESDAFGRIADEKPTPKQPEVFRSQLY